MDLIEFAPNTSHATGMGSTNDMWSGLFGGAPSSRTVDSTPSSDLVAPMDVPNATKHFFAIVVQRAFNLSKDSWVQDRFLKWKRTEQIEFEHTKLVFNAALAGPVPVMGVAPLVTFETVKTKAVLSPIGLAFRMPTQSLVVGDGAEVFAAGIMAVAQGLLNTCVAEGQREIFAQAIDRYELPGTAKPNITSDVYANIIEAEIARFGIMHHVRDFEVTVADIVQKGFHQNIAFDSLIVPTGTMVKRSYSPENRDFGTTEYKTYEKDVLTIGGGHLSVLETVPIAVSQDHQASVDNPGSQMATFGEMYTFYDEHPGYTDVPFGSRDGYFYSGNGGEVRTDLVTIIDKCSFLTPSGLDDDVYDRLINALNDSDHRLPDMHLCNLDNPDVFVYREGDEYKRAIYFGDMAEENLTDQQLTLFGERFATRVSAIIPNAASLIARGEGHAVPVYSLLQEMFGDIDSDTIQNIVTQGANVDPRTYVPASSEHLLDRFNKYSAKTLQNIGRRVLLISPISRNALVNFAIKNLYVPVGFIGFQPDCRCITESFVVGKAGDTTGNTYVCGGRLEAGSDASFGLKSATARMWLGAVITNQQNIVRQSNAILTNYAGGMSGKIFTEKASFVPGQLDRNGDMIIIPTPDNRAVRGRQYVHVSGISTVESVDDKIDGKIIPHYVGNWIQQLRYELTHNSSTAYYATGSLSSTTQFSGMCFQAEQYIMELPSRQMTSIHPRGHLEKFGCIGKRKKDLLNGRFANYFSKQMDVVASALVK